MIYSLHALTGGGGEGGGRVTGGVWRCLEGCACGGVETGGEPAWEPAGGEKREGEVRGTWVQHST